MSREPGASHGWGLGCHGASIFRPIPDSCNVLSNIKLSPEIYVVRAVATVIYGSHLIVGRDHAAFVDNQGTSHHGHFYVGPNSPAFPPPPFIYGNFFGDRAPSHPLLLPFVATRLPVS